MEEAAMAAAIAAAKWMSGAAAIVAAEAMAAVAASGLRQG